MSQFHEVDLKIMVSVGKRDIKVSTLLFALKEYFAVNIDAAV